MTKWVVGFVGVAIVCFILNDLFGNSPTALFGGQDDTVGEINGDRISMQEFQIAVQNMEARFTSQTNRNPGEREMATLREQAWLYLIAEHAFKPQYAKVGVEVTTEELSDMLYGKNIDEGLKVRFTDSVGVFRKDRLLEQLRQIRELPAGDLGRQGWDLFSMDLRPSRARMKYENLLVKTNYVTQAEAERQYHLDNDVSEIKYLYVPYFAVKDSAVTVTDADIKKYYDANKQKYKAEETRNLSYVVFPLVASAEDTLAIRNEMDAFSKQFHDVESDSAFATLNTEGSSPFEKYNRLTLPTYLNRETISKGLVMQPFIDNGSYKVVKVTDVGKDTTFVAKARHILIKPGTGANAMDEARAKAQKVLAEVKRGANFAAKALEVSDDEVSKMNGGDLSWFGRGSMVPAFENAIFSAKKNGILPELVETNYGFHIIDITDRDYSQYSIATIEKAIVPSQETQDAIYRKADLFATDIDGMEDFKARALRDGLNIYEANDLTSNDRFIGELGDAREMVTWLYRDGKINKASNIFDLDNDYTVAIMTNKADGGYRPLDDKLKAEITAIVKKEAQGKAIMDKLKGDAPLEDLAKAFPGDAVVNTASGVKLNTTNIANIGFDPIAVGKAFSVENGKRTAPFAGESGVTIIEVQNKTIAPSMGDYAMFKTQLQQTANNKSGMGINDAIKEKADIEDMRYKAY